MLIIFIQQSSVTTNFAYSNFANNMTTYNYAINIKVNLM